MASSLRSDGRKEASSTRPARLSGCSAGAKQNRSRPETGVTGDTEIEAERQRCARKGRGRRPGSRSNVYSEEALTLRVAVVPSRKLRTDTSVSSAMPRVRAGGWTHPFLKRRETFFMYAMRPVPVVCRRFAFCPHSSACPVNSLKSVSRLLVAEASGCAVGRTRPELGGRVAARGAGLVLLVERATTAATAEAVTLGVAETERGGTLRL